MSFPASPVPDLIRDLPASPPRGPGSSPGRDSRFGKSCWQSSGHGAFRLHHGLPPVWCTLHRTLRQTARTCGTASRRFVRAHCEIQNQNPRLVREIRRFRNLFASRKIPETLAARLETQTDHRRQPSLAGHDICASLIAAAEAPAQGRGGCRLNAGGTL